MCGEKIIEGTQCTIAWYMYYNKLSHKNPEVISNMIKEIGGKFGDFSVFRGNNTQLSRDERWNKENIINIDIVK